MQQAPESRSNHLCKSYMASHKSLANLLHKFLLDFLLWWLSRTCPTQSCKQEVKTKTCIKSGQRVQKFLPNFLLWWLSRTCPTQSCKQEVKQKPASSLANVLHRFLL